MDEVEHARPTTVASLDGLRDLWRLTVGDPEVRVAILDTQADLSHPVFTGASITKLATLGWDNSPNLDSAHGTQTASLIVGQKDDMLGPGFLGVAPRSTCIVIPIFSTSKPEAAQRSSQMNLAHGITQALEAGAHVINISASQRSESGVPDKILADAVERCAISGVQIIAATGNDGCSCLAIPASLPSVLAVGASDVTGQPLRTDNWHKTYVSHGIITLGDELVCAAPQGGFAMASGTSCAAAIISGIFALLLGLQRQRGATPSVDAVRRALLESASPFTITRGGERLAMRRMNINGAVTGLEFMMKARERRTIVDHPVAETDPSTEEPSMHDHPHISGASAGCGCGCSDSSTQKVYVLGRLGFDFGTESRRDSFAQNMPHGTDPNNAAMLASYLRSNPWEAARVIWTLSLDATPIYAIRPGGPFAPAAYERMRQLLEQQLNDSVERISLPGVIKGSVTLWTGLELPVVLPEIQGMYGWSTASLMKSLDDKKKPGKSAEQVRNFLERIYYECRNLGIAPQDRALNYAATNAFNVARIFEAASGQGMELDTLSVEKSPVCRPEAECWDVKLVFFDPSKQLERARQVYRTTVDVSDTAPVAVDAVRSWRIR